MATLETESSSVEQDLGTISQRELAVTEIFTLLLIVFVDNESISDLLLLSLVLFLFLRAVIITQTLTFSWKRKRRRARI